MVGLIFSTRSAFPFFYKDVVSILLKNLFVNQFKIHCDAD